MVTNNHILPLNFVNRSSDRQLKEAVREIAGQIKVIGEEVNIISNEPSIRYDNHLIIRDFKNKYKNLGPIALDRRVRKNLFEIECWVESREDFILSKLLYGSWQDYADALGCWGEV
ncbi:MAG: hypothetical protein ACFFAS_13580 [Promethearchaeota archaeon]